MKEKRINGIICMKDSLGIEYRLCRLEYTVRDDDTFEYVFVPDYGVIDALPEKEFQGIPGLDLDLRKERYVRKNMHPVFVTERTPSERRPDLRELVELVGMDYYDRMEWLIRTNTTYAGDNFFLVADDVPKEKISFVDESLSSTTYCRKILTSIGAGHDVYVEKTHIDDGNRKTVCDLLRTILRSNKHSEEYRKHEGARGRKKIDVSIAEIWTIKTQLEQGIISIEEATEKLGISRMTLYRRLRDLKDLESHPAIPYK